MAYIHDITSANSVLVLTVDTIWPSGVALEQFSVDSAAAMDNLQIAETRMGVDGHMAAGYVPTIYPVTINLEASSPSYKYLNAVWEAMQNKRCLYTCTLVATLPSIKYVHTWTKGVMKSGTPFPSIRKVLDPTQWAFDFETYTGTSY